MGDAISFDKCLESHIYDAIQIIAIKLCGEFELPIEYAGDLAETIKEYGLPLVLKTLDKTNAVTTLLGWDKMTFRLYNAILSGTVGLSGGEMDAEPNN